MTNKIKKSIIKIAGALSLRKIFVAVVAKAAGAMRALCKGCTDFVNIAGRRPAPTANMATERKIMTKIMTRRFAAMIGAIALVTLLAACGGGGGGGTSTPVTPGTPAPTVTLKSVVPAGGATSVAPRQTVTIDLLTTNATSVSAATLTVACGGSVVPGTVSVATTSDGFELKLVPTADQPPLSTCSGSGTVTVAGAGGTASLALSASYKTDALRYTDAIIANSDDFGWYPYRLSVTGGQTTGTVTFAAEKATNATSFQIGAFPLFNCAFNKTKLVTGAVKLNCQDAVSLARHPLVWNPVTNRITEYDGSEGAYPAISDATWVDVQTDAPPVVGWKAFAEIGAGWVWNSTTDGSTQHFKRKSDSTDRILPISIGLVKAYGGFSN